MSATQAQIDALTTEANQIATDLATAKSTLQAEIDQLAAANPGVDVTALTAAMAPLDQAVQQLGALTPDNTGQTPQPPPTS